MTTKGLIFQQLYIYLRSDSFEIAFLTIYVSIQIIQKSNINLEKILQHHQLIRKLNFRVDKYTFSHSTSFPTQQETMNLLEDNLDLPLVKSTWEPDGLNRIELNTTPRMKHIFRSIKFSDSALHENHVIISCNQVKNQLKRLLTYFKEAFRARKIYHDQKRYFSSTFKA